MPKRRQRRVRAAVATTLLAIWAVSILLPTSDSRALGMGSAVRVAHTASVLKATDTAHLRYISASGSLLYEEGAASGTLPGRMRVHFSVGATFSGSFTIYAHNGSIRGQGSATPHGSGVYESFVGSLTVIGGSGRYRDAHGQARLYGTFNRNTYALVVQTVGTLHY